MRINFSAFIRALKNVGLRYPLFCTPLKRWTISTEFETKFALCVGEELSKMFQPDSDLTEIPMRYIETVCFGCSVYAKRIIFEKFNISTERHFYLWLMGTCVVETAAEVDQCFTTMATINIKLGHFLRWLRRNKVSLLMRFWRLYIYSTATASVYRLLLWSTNISEAHNSVFKGTSDYLLMRCKGLDLVSLVQFLDKHDNTEFRNLNGDISVPLVSTPVLNRAARKRCRTESNRDGFIHCNGIVVSAS